MSKYRTDALGRYTRAVRKLEVIQLNVMAVERDIIALKAPHLVSFGNALPSAEWKLDTGLAILLSEDEEFQALEWQLYELKREQLKAKNEVDLASQVLKTYRSEQYGGK